jgi:hypothetical protein
MIRRLLLLGLVVYAAASIAKAASQRAADKQNDRHALSNWDGEGGTPAPDPGIPS